MQAVNALLIALDRLSHRHNVVILCTSNLIKAMACNLWTPRSVYIHSLIQIQDSAFLDRADVKQYIPTPCATARYEIYRTTYLDLAKSGIIAPVRDVTRMPLLDAREHAGGSSHVRCPPDQAHTNLSQSAAADRPRLHHDPLSRGGSPETLNFNIDISFRVVDEQDLPPFPLFLLHHFGVQESLPQKLWEVAEKSVVCKTNQPSIYKS